MELIHPEDLRVGNFIVITNDNRFPSNAIYPGYPLRVMSIDAPFIQVENPVSGFHCIDTRHTSMRKPSRSYVSTWFSQYDKKQRIFCTARSLIQVPVENKQLSPMSWNRIIQLKHSGHLPHYSPADLAGYDNDEINRIMQEEEALEAQMDGEASVPLNVQNPCPRCGMPMNEMELAGSDNRTCWQCPRCHYEDMR